MQREVVLRLCVRAGATWLAIQLGVWREKAIGGIDASRDPVRRHSAMKRIRLSRGGRGEDAARRRVWPKPEARSSFYAKASWPAAFLGPGAAHRSRRPPWLRARATARSGSASGLRDIRVARSPDAREPSLRRAATVRSSLMAEPSCGAPMAFGVHGGRGAGSPAVAERRVVRRHVCKIGDRFAALQPAMAACRADGSTEPARLEHGSRLPAVRPLGQPGSSAIQRPTKRRRAVQSAEGGCIHGRTQHRGAAGAGPRLRANSTMPSGSSKRTAT